MPLSSVRRPRRIMTRTLALGIGALVAAGAVAWTPREATGWNQGSAESTLWQLLNGARVNNGLAPVQSHGTLVSLARWRSSDMLANDYFSHTIEGCGCLVYTYYDSNGLSYDWAGENIGWNSGLDDSYSPVRVHEKFMASAGHRANVLDPRFTHGGVGAAAADNQMYQGYVQNTRMYTELFMQARAAAPAPPPPSSGGGGTPSAPAPAAPAPGAPAAAAPAAPEPTPTPAPQPKVVAVEVPQRPVSSAGIDGISERVTARPIAHLAKAPVDELLGQRAIVAGQDAGGTATAAPANLRVAVASAPEPGLLESVLGAIVGFLFG